MKNFTRDGVQKLLDIGDSDGASAGDSSSLVALADGQLPITQTALYTSPTSIRTLISKLVVFSNAANAQIVDLYVTLSGNSRKFRRIELLENEGGDVLEGESEIVLEPGDSIDGLTTTDAMVDYFMSGQQVDAS